MYGYELVAEIRRSTGSVVDLAEGCVYPVLHSMEKRELVATRVLERDGRRRVYYRLNNAGRSRLREVTAHWQRLTQAIDGVLGGRHAAAAD